MHREDYKILTQRKVGECHQETLVIFDWSGMTIEDYQAMAKSLIIWNFQTRCKKHSNEKIPEVLNVLVRAEVHKTPQLPPEKLMQKRARRDTDEDGVPLSKIDKMLAALSQEEIAILTAEVEKGELS